MDMQKSKEISWASDYGAETENGSSTVDIWQQYRGWKRKAPVPKERRGSIDRSLYTLNGYRNWTQQVKRNWSEE